MVKAACLAAATRRILNMGVAKAAEISEHTRDEMAEAFADEARVMLRAALSRSSSGAVPEDERCSDCMEARATVCYESGDDRCAACAKILDARMKERDRILDWAARKCDEQITGFKSDLHEAYDNGVRDCAKKIRDSGSRSSSGGTDV